MRVTIDASEVHQLADDIRRHADETPGLAERAVDKVGHDMHASAIAKAPRLTGLLDASDALTVTGLGFDLGPTVDYGAYQELGTSKMAPNPYLGPAFDEHLPNLEVALGDIGEGAVSRA